MPETYTHEGQQVVSEEIQININEVASVGAWLELSDNEEGGGNFISYYTDIILLREQEREAK